ncbi:MAG: transglycosylase SLT domain-containing protein [Symploca sp. SIO1B1]|nr:transglycosylase SLT domain-containing protein [Symploca sp. SIO1B1]
MKKHRSIFSPYSTSRRKERRKQLLLTSGVGLLSLIMGMTLLSINPNSRLGQRARLLQFQVNSFITRGDNAQTPVLRLASTSVSQRREVLQEIAKGKKSIDRSRARYLLAADLIEQQQGEEALGWLEGLEGEYPVLAAHIVLKRAQAYEIIGEQAKAEKAWKDLLKYYSHNPVAAEALYALLSEDSIYLKKRNEDSDDDTSIFQQIQELYQFSPEDPKHWEVALAKYPSHPRILQLMRQRLKEDPKQPELMLSLARYAFDQSETIPVLDQLVGNYGEAVSNKDQAIIQPEDWEAIALAYWKDRKYGQASQAYAQAAPTAENAYLAARALELAQKSTKAKRAYKKMVREFPNDPETAKALIRIAKLELDIEAAPYLDQAINQFPDQAGDALLAKSKVLRRLGSEQAAVEARELLLSEYGTSDAAAEYRWKMAQARAKRGDLEGAFTWAQPILTENPHSEPARQAGFWAGKWASKLGRQQDAEAIFEQVLANYPQSYYAWRSAVHLGWDVGDFPTVGKQQPKVVVPPIRPLLPLGSAALKELYQLGQDRDAWALWQAEFQNRLQPKVAEQFTNGLILLGVGEHLQGISQISKLEDRETPEEQAEYRALCQKLTYWHGLYPLPFAESIMTESQQRKMNPLLVSAVIRQESRFETDVQSSAGAIGLMQLMPSTGAWAAEKLSVKKYALEKPEDNIKLGTWFLAQTHQAHQNNSLLAVASYNAGQGNTAKWFPERVSTDPDEFVETIPFDETKNYVKQVFGNYWNYLRLYDPQVAERLAKYSAGESTAMSK